MPLYAIVCKDKPGALETRLAVRPKHLEYLAQSTNLKLAGALMAFTLSLDNTIVSSFVQVPGYTPWPVYIFGSLRVGLRPEVAAVSTLMLLLTLLALAVVAFVLRRMGDSSNDVAATLAGG